MRTPLRSLLRQTMVDSFVFGRGPTELDSSIALDVTLGQEDIYYRLPVTFGDLNALDDWRGAEFRVVVDEGYPIASTYLETHCQPAINSALSIAASIPSQSLLAVTRKVAYAHSFLASPCYPRWRVPIAYDRFLYFDDESRAREAFAEFWASIEPIVTRVPADSIEPIVCRYLTAPNRDQRRRRYSLSPVFMVRSPPRVTPMGR